MIDKLKMNELLNRLNEDYNIQGIKLFCEEGINWAGENPIEDLASKIKRGDWGLWFAQRINVDHRALTLAKGHCANTIRDLVQDERSLKAIDVAIAYGEGRATKEELDFAAKEAFDATEIGTPDAYAAYAAVSDSATSETTTVAAYTSSIAPDMRRNLIETAEICKVHLGNLVIDKVNELMKN
jgi:hypothetical protein